MKKLLIAFSALFACLACTESPDVDQLAPNQRNVTIIAKTDISRASYDPNTMSTRWEATDIIGCFAEYNNNIKFKATNITANEFSSLVTKDPSEFYFYFPYNREAKMANGVLKSELATTQLLRAGAYAPTIPLVAYTTSLDDVSFSNLCGVLSFNVRSNIDRILTSFSFESNDGSPVAGEYTVDMNQKVPTLSLGSQTSSKVTLEGNVPLTAETDYRFYIFLPPTVHAKGFTITLGDAKDRTFEQVFTKKLTVKRSVMTNVSSVLYFESPLETTELELVSMTSTSPSATFVIDQETLTARASLNGFTNPKSSKIVLNYNATFAGEKVTPNVTINGENYSSKNSYDLTMPLEITLSYGEESKTYIAKLSQLVDTGLPVVYINTSTGKDVPVNDKDTWIEDSQFWIDGEGRTSFNGGITFEDVNEVACAIKGRGNLTWDWVKDTESLYPNGAKRPYAVKLGSKQSIFGMPKHKRWVLLANYGDKSMMRNILSFRLANAIANAPGGSGEWHPSGQSVELVLNGIHRGNYLLCEHIKIADGCRVNGTEFGDATVVDGSEISYLLEGDRNWGNDATETLYWRSYREQTSWKQSSAGTYIYGTNYTNGSYSDGSTYKFRWGLKSPDDGDLADSGLKNSTEYQFIYNHVTEVEKFLFTSSFTSKTIAEIEQYIDLDSFIEYWLVYEMSMNQELNNPGSAYMHYYNVDKKLYMGPVWDFDYATYLYTFDDEGLYKNKATHFQNANALWYCRILQNPNVQSYISERWPYYKAAIEGVQADILQIQSYLAKSAEYNFNMWKTSKDPASEKNMSHSAVVTRINTNVSSRINDLNTLITNKRYK
jgi:hypothetical protein